LIITDNKLEKRVISKLSVFPFLAIKENLFVFFSESWSDSNYTSHLPLMKNAYRKTRNINQPKMRRMGKSNSKHIQHVEKSKRIQGKNYNNVKKTRPEKSNCHRLVKKTRDKKEKCDNI